MILLPEDSLCGNDRLVSNNLLIVQCPLRKTEIMKINNPAIMRSTFEIKTITMT